MTHRWRSEAAPSLSGYGATLLTDNNLVGHLSTTSGSKARRPNSLAHGCGIGSQRLRTSDWVGLDIHGGSDPLSDARLAELDPTVADY